MPKRYYTHAEVLKIIDQAMDEYSKLRQQPYYSGIAGHLFAKEKVIRRVFSLDVEIIRNFYYKCGNKVDVIQPIFENSG